MRFPEIGVPPVIIHSNGIFAYKPSFLWYPNLWNPPHISTVDHIWWSHITISMWSIYGNIMDRSMTMDHWRKPWNIIYIYVYIFVYIYIYTCNIIQPYHWTPRIHLPSQVSGLPCILATVDDMGRLAPLPRQARWNLGDRRNLGGIIMIQRINIGLYRIIGYIMIILDNNHRINMDNHNWIMIIQLWLSHIIQEW